MSPARAKEVGEGSAESKNGQNNSVLNQFFTDYHVHRVGVNEDFIIM
jgi:hypothetical protein